MASPNEVEKIWLEV